MRAADRAQRTERTQRTERKRRTEQGQLTLLMLGFTIVVLLLLAVVTDVSKAFLVRRDLAQLADGAALAGTRGIASSVVVGSDPDASWIELDPARAEREIGAYLAAVDNGGYETLSWTVAVNGDTVAVRLQATVALPLTVPGTSGTVAVTADGASQLRRR